MRKNQKKVNNAKNALTRRGITLIVVLAVLILLVNVITASFSWFIPNSQTANNVEYSASDVIRSEDCKFATFAGVLQTEGSGSSQVVTGITYPSVASSTTLSAGQTAYFRTEIINENENFASNVSLFISEITASGNVKICVTYPSNTVRTITSNVTDYSIIRNANVKQYDEQDVNGPGLLEVEWFVECVSGSCTVNPNNLYLMYS